MSIIIPVYNGAAVLDRCLRSVLEQTFEDWQAVIVDDGSTDHSHALAERWAQRDSRFRVHSIAHSGPGAARNAGLKLAQGEYVVYMDADDYWVRSDLLQQLDQRIRELPADVYMYQMAKVTESGAVLERFDKPPFARAEEVLPLGEVYQDLVRDGHTLAAAWNKCVRRDLLVDGGIRFREDTLCEDIDWVLQLFSCVRTICLLNIRAYAYTQHRTVSRSTRADAPNDLVSIVADWADRITSGGISHVDAVAGVLAFEYGICMGSYHRLSEEKKRMLREKIHLLQYGLDKKTKMIAGFHDRFGFSLTCLAIRVYLLLRRIW